MKRTQTGLTSSFKECNGLSTPESGFTLKDWRLKLSWFAAIRIFPEGSMAKLRGKIPPEGVWDLTNSDWSSGSTE